MRSMDGMDLASRRVDATRDGENLDSRRVDGRRERVNPSWRTVNGLWEQVTCPGEHSFAFPERMNRIWR
jgi:hypothetical protein